MFKASTRTLPINREPSPLQKRFKKRNRKTYLEQIQQNSKMSQRSESPRSQASPKLAQNVLRYESPQNINNNNMNIYIMLLEYAQLMMLNSVVRVSRCLPDFLENGG